MPMPAATPLLATTYFGPVQWYQKLFRHDRCLLELHESFQKQTYRNRCLIATASGPQALTVPVVRDDRTTPDGTPQPITALRISDHGNWRRLHWNALCSAYGESPFFEYYADDLRPLFEPRWEFLFEMNLAITHAMCQLLGIGPTLELTTSYRPPAADAPAAQPPAPGETAPWADYREAIRPKHPLPDADFQPRPYWQVFGQRNGFLPNLSVLDLLCCQGPEAVLWL